MSSKLIIFILVLAVVFGGWFLFRSGESRKEAVVQEESTINNSNNKNPMVTLHTNKGDIKIELFLDKTPITAENFLKLAKDGYYDNTKFHRVIAGFMIQGGDPNSRGDDVSLYGRGGPGYTIQDEFVPGFSNVRGTISMANTGAPNSGGSQFFINLVDNVGLDYDKPPMQSSHPVFGKIVGGMDVVDAIAASRTGANDVPLEPVIIERISVSGDSL